MSPNSAPGYKQYPNHLIATKLASVRVQVTFKGHAAYYSLRDGPENAVWTYEKAYDEMSALRELLAFYPEKVDSVKTT